MRSPRQSAIRLLQLMMIASVVLPALLFVFASWLSYRHEHAVADDRIERSLDIVHEHALKVFQTGERAIAEVAVHEERPGMVVEAALHGRGASPRVTVPASAIVRTEQGPVVFVKTGAETFALRPVTQGARTGSRIAIEKGVQEGERVVVTEAFPLLSAAAPR